MSGRGLQPIGGELMAPAGAPCVAERFRLLGIQEVGKEKEELLRRSTRRMLSDWELAQLKACDAALDELRALRSLTRATEAAIAARSSSPSAQGVEA